MLIYNSKLHSNARALRQNMTDSERQLWYYVRRKQLFGIQFYRQKPIGNYIVDFYAPAAKLIIEIDGAQHFEEKQKVYDEKRSLYLTQQGLKVLRFNNLEVLKHTSYVLEVIMETMKERIF